MNRWVETSGLDPRQPGFSLPPSLLEKIEESRIILLGECSHFTHEKSDYRLWWIDQLSRRWPVRVGEELGRSDAARIERYLATGEEAFLDQVPTFGYRGDDRTDREDSPTGILKASHDRYPTELFKAEQLRFYRGVRALQRPISLFGFDINGSLGSPYVDIRRILATAPRNPARDAFLNALKQVPGESMAEEFARLEDAGDLLRAMGGGETIRAAARELMVALHTLEFVMEAYPAADYADLNPAMAQREQLMKQQVRWALAELAPNEKLVLMAHAFHLARDDDAIQSQAGAGPGGDSDPSLGHHLVQELGESTFAVWMVHGGGDDSQPFPDLSNHFDYPQDSLNGLLLQACDREMLLPLDGLDPSRKSFPVGHMYNSVAQVNMRTQTDVVHFVPMVTPMRGD